ncbi:MAG: nascent polypeptide-associated complex protein [Candidatus Micrarchaeota archaeon]
MIPGMGGMDPKSIARAMKQMGIQNEEIPAKKVIIEQEGGKIIIENPQVVKISMQGQLSFQISGKVSEQAGINEEDVKMVASSANVSEEKAKKALQEANGDIAEAILKLQKQDSD